MHTLGRWFCLTITFPWDVCRWWECNRHIEWSIGVRGLDIERFVSWSVAIVMVHISCHFSTNFAESGILQIIHRYVMSFANEIWFSWQFTVSIGWSLRVFYVISPRADSRLSVDHFACTRHANLSVLYLACRCLRICFVYPFWGWKSDRACWWTLTWPKIFWNSMVDRRILLKLDPDLSTRRNASELVAVLPIRFVGRSDTDE
jgi:hypothetical protein